MNKEEKRHDTDSISVIVKKRTKLLYILIILFTVAVLAIIYLPISDIFGLKETIPPKIRQMKELASKIGKLETEVNQKQTEILKLVEEYNNQSGEKLEIFGSLGFTDKEKKLFEDKIKNQENASIKSFLRDIIDKNDEISSIKSKIKGYETFLPQPHIVSEGENHYQIAMNYLINEKAISKEKASALVERTAMLEQLAAGFKVWNFYSGDEYGTIVTQGNAPISPNELKRQEKQKLINEKDNAIAAKDKLKVELKVLESKKNQLISQTNTLNSKINQLKAGEQALNNRIKVLSQEEEKMKIRINSLFYVIDSKNNLIQKGIIKGGFLRRTKLNETSPEYFNDSIDLRKKKTIEISAKEFGLREIGEITLYPKFYKRDIDYEVKIEENKQKAVLTILADEKFKSDRVVISVK